MYNSSNNLEDCELSSVNRGRDLAQMSSLFGSRNLLPTYHTHLSIESHSIFAKVQQTKFQDQYNFYDHFDLELFFKLIEVTECRSQLFTIFQICIQIKGFKFPKQFALEWIKNGNEQKDNKCYHFIEQGLKLGIFLGDSGWFDESALVLSFTYELISKKWVCSDETLVLMKTLQCLTKWLLVLSNFYNFDEAKLVLQYILETLKTLELQKKKICIAYSYVAVSQYYYQLMEFKEAWFWALKAVNELSNKSSDVLQLLVIGHVIRVCSATNKLNSAKKLIEQVHMYDNEIEQHICVDMLLNEACYSLRADLAENSIYSYYVALDSRRNLFGYFNLHTANVFVDYAYARYVCDYETSDFDEAMSSVLQGIYIMECIGLPNNHMLLVNAGRIKALILEEKALDIIHWGIDSEQWKKSMLDEAEELHKMALQASLKTVGENNLLTAKHYCNLGRLYQSKINYQLSEEMHLKAIKIKEAILGEDNPEVALSLGHLASLYTYQMEKYEVAEQLYLRSKAIYEKSFGNQYTGLLYDLQGLAHVYRELGNFDLYDQCTRSIEQFHVTRGAWLEKLHSSSINDKFAKSSFNIEIIKNILSSNICEKH
ncbi:amyloid protein-binding protein 2 isoform X2 [Daktulosphaira vitifoliae]|uniref:amyloid protein-binding protein 2 isoform X2 n=1 Tax=Daktulosphaira vitifoliae TaxID=58002 RepID=UPI0021AA9D11|nr:amyloid protein-binding protein 2 isoform X2 [Daktulosphaira vitifoliae]